MHCDKRGPSKVTSETTIIAFASPVPSVGGWGFHHHRHKCRRQHGQQQLDRTERRPGNRSFINTDLIFVIIGDHRRRGWVVKLNNATERMKPHTSLPPCGCANDRNGRLITNRHFQSKSHETILFVTLILFLMMDDVLVRILLHLSRGRVAPPQVGGWCTT